MEPYTILDNQLNNALEVLKDANIESYMFFSVYKDKEGVLRRILTLATPNVIQTVEDFGQALSEEIGKLPAKPNRTLQ